MLLAQYTRLLVRFRSLFIALVLVGLGVGAGVTAVLPPKYEASAVVLVSIGDATSLSDLNQGGAYVQQVVKSYAAMATTAYVLDAVRTELGLDGSLADLKRHVEATSDLNTSLITITATDGDPVRSARIANRTAQRLSISVAGLTAGQGSAATSVTTLEQASVPTRAASPVLAVDLALGAVAGLLLAFLIALGIHRFGTRMRTAADVEEVTDLPLLGSIPRDPRFAGTPLLMQQQPSSPVAESVRRLRTNLQYVTPGARGGVFVVTSSMEGEGKSVTVANLATAFAASGSSVVVVDGDLRRPTIASLFGLEGGVGLTDVLIGTSGLDDALQRTGAGPCVLPAGGTAPNPNELLQSERMTDVLTALHERFEVVLVDSPPLGPVGDAAVLAVRATGTLVVAALGSARRPQLASSLGSLAQINAPVLGLILTKAASRASAYGYGYGYGVTAPTTVAEPAEVAPEARSIAAEEELERALRSR